MTTRTPNCIKSAAQAGSDHPIQTGFSLIEVLVTIVLLTFGLLGVAGLLVSGVANASSSESLAKANQLAADMADRIRANPTVALSATSEYLLNNNTTYQADPSRWTDTVPSTTASVALSDKKSFMQSLTAQLPLGRGMIFNDPANRKITIKVAWGNCVGTLNDSEKTSCNDNSGASFRISTFELRL